ncbi:MAG: hypothetical protein LIO52_06115 [Oscillospiraceae bacterium]|nr:hypothetical protein [Oscillospiraceae bacterium]
MGVYGKFTKNNLSPTSMLPCGEEITKYEHDYRTDEALAGFAAWQPEYEKN